MVDLHPRRLAWHVNWIKEDLLAQISNMQFVSHGATNLILGDFYIFFYVWWVRFVSYLNVGWVSLARCLNIGWDLRKLLERDAWISRGLALMCKLSSHRYLLYRTFNIKFFTQFWTLRIYRCRGGEWVNTEKADRLAPRRWTKSAPRRQMSPLRDYGQVNLEKVDKINAKEADESTWEDGRVNPKEVDRSIWEGR